MTGWVCSQHGAGALALSDADGLPGAHRHRAPHCGPDNASQIPI